MPDEITTDQVVEPTPEPTPEISEEAVKNHPLYKRVLAEAVTRRQQIKALEEAQNKPDDKPVINEDTVVEKALARFRAEQERANRPTALLAEYKLSPEYLPALINAGDAAESVAKALAATKRLDNIPTGGDVKANPTADIATRLRAKYNLPSK